MPTWYEVDEYTESDELDTHDKEMFDTLEEALEYKNQQPKEPPLFVYECVDADRYSYRRIVEET